MDLEAIYYIGQTVAVIALVVSLVFVGIQVRSANNLAKIEVSDRVLKGHEEVLMTLMADPTIGKIIRRANQGQDDFTDAEKGALSILFVNISTTTRSLLDAKRRGLLEPEAEDFAWRAVCFNLSRPAHARIWRAHTRSGFMGAAMLEAVNKEFDKRYPELAGSLIADRAVAQPVSFAEEEETSA